jgi:hypothetical protein
VPWELAQDLNALRKAPKIKEHFRDTCQQDYYKQRRELRQERRPTTAASSAAAPSAFDSDAPMDTGADFIGGDRSDDDAGAGGGPMDADDGAAPMDIDGQSDSEVKEAPDNPAADLAAQSDEEVEDERREDALHAAELAAAPDDGPVGISAAVGPSDAPITVLLMGLAAWAARHRITADAMKQLLKLLWRFFSRLGKREKLPGDPHQLWTMPVLSEDEWPKDLNALGASICSASHSNRHTYKMYSLCPTCGLAHEDTKKVKCECGAYLLKPTRQQIGSQDRRDRLSVDPSASIEPFPYVCLKDGLQTLYRRPGFLQLTEQWRKKYSKGREAGFSRRLAWKDVEYNAVTGWPITPADGTALPTMSDVHDGQLWELYQYTDSTAEKRFFLDEATASRLNKQMESARYRFTVDDGYERMPAKVRTALGAESSHDVRCYKASTGVRQPLLAEDYTLALQLNVDWFQPFGKSDYSIGAIYLAILNLPRHLRYRPEYMMLVGVLPGPRKTKLHVLQGALAVLTKDLGKFFAGQVLTMADGTQKKIRCFLFSVACDSPARAEVIGAMSHSATRCCAFCTQDFPRRDARIGATASSAAPNCSWSATSRSHSGMLAKSRTHDSHRRAAEAAASLLPDTSAKSARESQCGSRKCALMDLPAFDTVLGAPLDAMHNIDLGMCNKLM